MNSYLDSKERIGHWVTKIAGQGPGDFVREKDTMILAMEQREFIFYHQPIVSSFTGQIEHYESLARWNHQGRVMDPVLFLPELHRHGLLEGFTRYAIINTVQNIYKSNQVGISVNISPAVIDLSLVLFITEMVMEYNIDPGRLILEVTEEFPITVESRANLETLRNTGIKLAMDDFGSGFASLAVLDLFRGGFLKLDRSLIGSDQNQGIRENIGSIVEMAHSFEIKVIAEGVEDQFTAGELAAIHVDLQQGFLYGRPGLDFYKKL